MPIWNELKRYYDNDKIIYEVEYDDMKSYLPEDLKMFSYPSIVSYNKKTAEIFKGNSRTIDSVSEFINKYVKSLSQARTQPKTQQQTRIQSQPTQRRPNTAPIITALPLKPRAKPKSRIPQK
jgi:hypothetical protein